MQLEDDRRNSVIKWQNPIEFELVWFILPSSLVLDGHQGLIIELEDAHKDSVTKRQKSIEFGLVWFRSRCQANATTTLLQYRITTCLFYLEINSFLRCKKRKYHLNIWQELQSYLGNVLNETLALRSFETTLHAGITAELERRDRYELLKAERLARGHYIFIFFV